MDVWMYCIHIEVCVYYRLNVDHLLNMFYSTDFIHPKSLSRHQRQNYQHDATVGVGHYHKVTYWLHHLLALSGDDWYTATILVSPLNPITLLAYYLWG